MTEETVALHQLTTAQRGIWFGQQLAPGNPAYIIGELLSFEAPVDPLLLSRAVDAVIRVTTTLHTRFVETAEGVRQTFVLPATNALRMVQLADADAVEAWIATDLHQAATEFHDRPFGFALLNAADGRQLFMHRYHHLIVDGAGRAEVIRRLAAAYTALAETGAPPPCAPDELGPFLAADAAYASSAVEAADRAYWHGLLGSAPEPVLAAAATAPPGGLHLTVAMDDTGVLTRRFAAACAMAGIALPQALAAAVAILMQSISGRQTVLLNLASRGLRGRGRRDVPTMTSNSTPLPITLQAGMTLANVAGQIAVQLHGARRHMRYRGEALARELLPSGMRAFGPHVNVMLFDYDCKFVDSSFTVRTVYNGPVEDIGCSLYDRGTGAIDIDLHANPALYDLSRLDELRTALTNVLTNFITLPARTLGAYPLIDDAVLERVTQIWSRRAEPATIRTWPEMLAAQMTAHPAAEALRDGGESWSYARLDAEFERIGPGVDCTRLGARRCGRAGLAARCQFGSGDAEREQSGRRFSAARYPPAQSAARRDAAPGAAKAHPDRRRRRGACRGGGLSAVASRRQHRTSRG